MSRLNLILLSVAIIAAGALYVWKGKPGIADQPFDARAAELAERQATDLSPDELLTLLQVRAVDFPEDAEPHYYIGVILRETGRPEDADRAFRSALRRDQTHVPSLVALADLMVQMENGDIRPGVAQLYHRAWSLDSEQVRAGFMAGLPMFRAGSANDARAHWEKVANGLAEDDPRQAMLTALISAAEAETENQPG
ncbi:MAG: hypothetical protein AAGJ29_00745 [Pseudomonadota bacterium]